MLKTYLYIPEDLRDKIVFTAKTQNKSKAEVLREALEEGINSLIRQKSGGASVLLKLSQFKGPEDASANLDYYLWGLPKKNHK